MSSGTDKAPAHFKTMAQVSVPQGRKGSGQAEGGVCHQSALGRIGGKQREGTFSTESRHEESWADGCNRQRRQVPVRVECKRIPRETTKLNMTMSSRPLDR
jgi:hypothetical protein